jgi:hypothetical protein
VKFIHSFSETKAQKYSEKNRQEYIQFNRHQFSRIFPKGSRVTSSNYDPTPAWLAGCQLVALNYQVPSFELNQRHQTSECF